MTRWLKDWRLNVDMAQPTIALHPLPSFPPGCLDKIIHIVHTYTFPSFKFMQKEKYGKQGQPKFYAFSSPRSRQIEWHEFLFRILISAKREDASCQVTGPVDFLLDRHHQLDSGWLCKGKDNRTKMTLHSKTVAIGHDHDMNEWLGEISCRLISV